jgi:hypothetical protein
LIVRGLDPGAEKKAAAIAGKLSAASTFKCLGDEYLDNRG